MRIDRLIGVLAILLQKERVTAAQLAEKFEVSSRTIYRDIEAISKAGIPIAAESGIKGGIYIMDGFTIDRTLLTREDLKSILTGLKSLDSVCKDASCRQLMDKISADDHGDGDIIIDLAGWDRSAISEKLEIIKRSIEKGEMISFVYCSPNGEDLRIIEPYHIVFQWSSWYVWGFCNKRFDYRLFKLSRLYDLKNTGEKCPERRVPPYKMKRLWHLEGQIKATVRFDPLMKWRVIDEFGFELPEFNEDVSSVLTQTWADKQSFFGQMLSYGDRAEIISPDDLRIEFSELVKKISEIYKI